ncbi:pyrroloquinoline quinone biosynthesis protein PqqB [Aquisediminimonas sediminicola]|uniref:pyrroloquinoline quinone biosynthesis protein PqqB n=1 Tax=Alteraquisediminimonas sediminicola TaxID=2676787 RepID=UPI001C8D8429
MKIVVLGAAAGGGFPQWNSNAIGCQRARASDLAAPPRTQASLAVSGDGQHWHLLNASPDLRQQINQTEELHPKSGLRSTPISSVILTGGDVDVIAGLLTLRERQPFTVFATQRILDILDANPIFEVLARDVVVRKAIALDQTIALAGGLTLELFAVPGKIPLYLEADDEMPALTADETTVAAVISDGSHRLFYIPGCAAVPDALASRLAHADVLFFDGTLWRDDEMVTAGIGTKTGRRMGHMSLSDPGGTIETFRDISIGRKFLIHMNNSNPVLLANSAERAEAEDAGWTVTHDGLRVEI